MTDTDKRAAFTQGLREIADFLDQNPDVKLPYLGADVWAGIPEHCLSIYLTGVFADPRDELAVIARAMGNASKVVDEDGGRFYVLRKFGAITLAASADRASVCERVVTGTREVTKEVRDPEALAAVPMVEVTEIVEDVEWVCRPLLKAPTSLLSVES
jgi:hypothetical protein